MFSNVSTRISHPWSAASSPERLTPRGGPRQISVVGVLWPVGLMSRQCPPDLVASRLLVVTTFARPTSCSASKRRLTFARTAFFAGRLCPDSGSRLRIGGVSNPPVWRPCRPQAGPEGCSRPRAPRPSTHQIGPLLQRQNALRLRPKCCRRFVARGASNRSVFRTRFPLRKEAR